MDSEIAQTPDATCRARVFISWSGDRAKHVARTLRKWIPYVLQSVDPWMSEQDIKPGTRWASELAETLDGVDFGVLCLTPESRDMPWVLFEAGALAKTLKHSVVCPYLVDMELGALKGPLNQFNAVMADESGTLVLIRALNAALPKGLQIRDRVLEDTFNQWWPNIKQALSEMPSPPSGHSIATPDSGLGLEFLAESRSIALEAFRKHIEAEMRRGTNGCISIVGTSLRGFLFYAGVGFNGPEVIKEAIKNQVSLRLMLLNPVMGDLRAAVEGNQPIGSIPNDIWHDMIKLRHLGVERESVHFYDAGPTVFTIATSDRMLLNPYPACQEAQAGFTLIVQKTGMRTDIYQQYISAHVDPLWSKHSRVVTETEWDTSIHDNAKHDINPVTTDKK